MRFLLVVLVVLVVLGVGWTANCAAEQPVQRIGVLLPLSGAWADWGMSIHNGIELGIEDFGDGIQLVVEDDHCEPRRSVTAAIKLFSVDQVRIVLGPGCLMNVKAVAPVAQKYGAIVLGTGGLDRDVLSRHKNVIDITTSVYSEAEYLAAYILSLSDIKAVSILHGTNAFGEELAGTLAARLTAGDVKVLAREKTDFSTSDFRAVIPRLMKGKPDAIFVHQGEASTGTFVKQTRALGYKGALFGPYTIQADTVLNTAGAQALEGMRYTYNLNSADGTPEKQRFEKRYMERYRRAPNAHALMVYDMMAHLAKAVKKCGGTKAKCVADYIRQLGETSGVSGIVRFNPDGSAQRPFGIKIVRDGKFEWLTKDVKITVKK